MNGGISKAVVTLALTCLPFPPVIEAESVSYTPYVIATGGDPAATVISSNADYYSLYLSRVCIDRDDRVWSRNNLAVTVTVEVNGQKGQLPLYAKYDPAITNCIGLVNARLLESIPAQGKQLIVGIEILRRDTNDLAKQIIDVLTTSSDNPALKTYAASAIPYVGLVGAASRLVYGAVKGVKPGDTLFSLSGTAFSPAEQGSADGFELRDQYFLVYKGSKPPTATSLSVDANGAVWEAQAEGKPKALERGPFVLLRIKKYKRRTDYGGREWQRRFQQALRATHTDDARKGDFKEADRLLNEAKVLLAADSDYTQSDQDTLTTEWEAALTKAKAAVNGGKAEAVLDAVREATVNAKPLSKVQSAVGTEDITLTPELSRIVQPAMAPAPEPPAVKVIAPTAFVRELEKPKG